MSIARSLAGLLMATAPICSLHAEDMKFIVRLSPGGRSVPSEIRIAGRQPPVSVVVIEQAGEKNANPPFKCRESIKYEADPDSNRYFIMNNPTTCSNGKVVFTAKSQL